MTVNGSWGSWTKWSECDRDCEGGVKRRNRACNAPSPSCGGVPCEGEPREEMSCNEDISCKLGAAVVSCFILKEEELGLCTGY